MASTYGSGNPNCVKVDHLGGGLPVHSKSSPWKKAALAAAGAALFLGGALVMYEGWNAPFSEVSLASTGSESPMTLESATTSTDQTNLMSGQPVLLRLKYKSANLCADDGGGTKPDVTFVTGQPCNPSNPNQLFIYNSATYQFKSAKKANLCLDDGGGRALTLFRLSTCDSKSEDQRLTYDATTNMFKNPSKKGMCMGDGGTTFSGTAKFPIWYCSDKNNNQHFEVLSQATLAAEQKKVLEAVAGGANFILRIAGKEGLCASGSGTATASTSFVPAACDKTSKKQLFSYDASTKRFKAAEKAGLCLDDGGGSKAAKTNVRLSSCSTSSADQLFSYDPATMMFSQPNKAKLCLDDGSSIWLAAPRLILKECDAYSTNQHFEYVLQTEPVTAAPVVTTTSTSVETSATDSNPVINSPSVQQTESTTTPRADAETLTPTTSTVVETSAPQAATYPAAEYTSTSTQQVPSYAETTPPVPSSTETLSFPTHQETQPSSLVEPTSPISQSTTTTAMIDPAMTKPEPSQMMTPTAVEPGVTEDRQGDTLTSTSTQSAMTEPEVVSAQHGDTVTSTSTQPHTNEPDTTSTQQGDTLTSTSMQSAKTEPEIVSAQQGETVASTPAESDMTKPGITSVQQGETAASIAVKPDMTTAQTSEVASTGISAANSWHDEDISVSTAELPDQIDANVPPPDVPVAKKTDMPLANYGDRDWNLLAPSNETVSIVNADNSAAISAAEIFQYLQTLKDRADVEHEVMMYRYKRTYQCASAGLQTLAKDAVTSDEYHVLVQWMYDHCAAGATDVAPVANPSPPTDDQMKKEDVAPLVDDKDTDVKRQFMTKLDFYYEIKNHFAEKNEELVGDAAVTNLRSEETVASEKKLADCIEEASERYGYDQEGGYAAAAKDAISSVATCIAS
ncbi:hypothetical protein PRNP1_013455 [Phytophthora ramorum]